MSRLSLIFASNIRDKSKTIKKKDKKVFDFTKKTFYRTKNLISCEIIRNFAPQHQIITMNNNRNSFAGVLPLVTKNIIIINGIIWLAQFVLLNRAGIDLSQQFGLHFPASSDFRLYQLVTYMFLHDPYSFSHVSLTCSQSSCLVERWNRFGDRSVFLLTTWSLALVPDLSRYWYCTYAYSPCCHKKCFQ